MEEIEQTLTVNSEIATLIFAILSRILFNSYIKFQNANLNYCAYDPVEFSPIISEFTVIKVGPIGNPNYVI